MKKLFISSLCALSSALSAWAVPANPKPISYTLPDGSSIMVQVEGDEYARIYRDLDGRILTLEADGQLRRATDVEAAEITQNFDAVRRNGPGVHASTFTRRGDVKACVILVQFSDVKFTTPNPQQYFSRWCNEAGFSDDGCQGSVRDYFMQSSNGTFRPTFDVYGPVTLSSARSAYSATSDAYKMATQAAKALDSTVDFSQYDVDGNGYIDNIAIIFAGQGGNDGGSNAPWPHGYDAPTNIFQRTSVDGKIIEHYCCAGERNGANDKPVGPGTFIHEFGHVLGLCDLYSSPQNQYTPNWWNVMDIGNYLNDGRSPLLYSSFERYALDWLMPTELNQPAKVYLDPLIDTNFACIIQTGRANDFYLLEYRPKRSTGFDNYFYGDGGMLIWHIDYSDSSKFANGVKPNSDTSHLRVDLVEADNEANISTYSNIANDVWPGGTNNTSFTGSTSPAMYRWNSSSGSATTAITDKPITNIRRTADKIAFDFMGGSTTNIIGTEPPSFYTYTVKASPAQGGYVAIGTANSGKMTMDVEGGSTVVMYATPANGYTFVNWTRDGTVVGTSSQLFQTASAATAGTYTANFRSGDTPVDPDPVVEDYCYIAGNSSASAGRYCSSLTISDDKSDAELALGLQTMAGQALYHDKTAQVFATEAGATITIAASGSQSWVHSYVYVDWDGDGFKYDAPTDYLAADYSIKPGADLVYYSRWAPTGKDPGEGGAWYSSADGSLGSTGDVHKFNPTETSATFTIPADTPTGTYRVRVKHHWCSLDPCGEADSNTLSNNTMAAIGGVMADFTIDVKGVETPKPGPDPAEDYCFIAGNSASNAERYCSSLTISDDKSDAELQMSLQSAAGQALYYDNSTQTFISEPGATVSIAASGSQSWMHSYVYVDWDGNGFTYAGPTDYLASDYSIKPGADLVYYSRWAPSGKDPNEGGAWYSSTDGSLGSSGEVHNFDPTKTPATFTIPADTPEGTYRVRVKHHWCSLNPCGEADVNTLDRNSMASVGGVMADFTLQVKAAPAPVVPPTYYSITVEATDGGKAWIGDDSNCTYLEIADNASDRSAQIHALANDNFTFARWEHSGRLVTTLNSYTFTIVNESNQGVYTAVFEPKEIDGIAEAETVASTAVYYDLSGRRVQHPVKGQLYLRVSGGDGTTKVKY